MTAPLGGPGAGPANCSASPATSRPCSVSSPGASRCGESARARSSSSTSSARRNWRSPTPTVRCGQATGNFVGASARRPRRPGHVDGLQAGRLLIGRPGPHQDPRPAPLPLVPVTSRTRRRYRASQQTSTPRALTLAQVPIDLADRAVCLIRARHPGELFRTEPWPR